jgi:uncharacterized cupredoxin-like copper-binding protein
MAHDGRQLPFYNVAMKKLAVLTLILPTLLILTACSTGGSGSDMTDEKAMTLVATDIAFDAERVEVAAGQRLSVTLDNQGVLEHDFSINAIPLAEAPTSNHAEEPEGHDMSQLAEEPEVHVAAAAGGHSTIEFVPTAPGEYEFYCTVPGHREAGMKGVLVVN